MKKGFDIITIIFWIAIIFYLDPGGFIVSSAEMDVDATRTVLFKFGTLALAYSLMILRYNSSEFNIVKENMLRSYFIIMIIWFLYYFLWFYGLNNTDYPGPIKMIMRNQRMFIQMLIVFPIAYFASIQLNEFIKLLSWTTVIIMIMFLITVYLNIPLVDFTEMSRGFTYDLTRYFMKGYGIMHFTLPLAISLLMMKYKKDWMIIIAGALIIVLTFVSIFRRDMVGIIEYLILIAFFVNYIYGNQPFNFIWRFVNIKSLALVTLIIVVISYTMPNFFLVTWDMIENTYRTAILGENTIGRSEDVRMSLTAQSGIVAAITDNFLLGTGFNEAWNTGEGGARGLEGSDYIFLASFGMYGFIGLLIFLPFYVLTIRIIIKFLRLLKNNLEIIQQNQKTLMYPVIVGLAASAEFGRNILEYPNWFYPIGATMYSPKYLIYFGLLIGSYYQIVKQIYAFKFKKFKE